MFRFENLAALSWLWIVGGLVGLFLFFSRRLESQLQKAIHPRLLPVLTLSRSRGRKRIKFVLHILVLVGFILALARPQADIGQKEIKSEGTQIVFMVDVSNSMMAQDLVPSRLDVAKSELIRLVNELGGDQVGLVAFAGSAALLAPLTNDKSAIRMLIEGLAPESVSTQGTYFERGLQEAWDLFKRLQNDKEESVATRLVIIASDGEDHEPGALKVAEQMSQEGIKIFALGFGTEQGGVIPNKSGGGGTRRDKNGNEIVSRFKPEALRKLAEIGGGSFYQVTFGNQAVEQIRNDINKLQKAQFESLIQTEYAEKYQWILAIAIILAFVELVFSERRSGVPIWRGRFGGVP